VKPPRNQTEAFSEIVICIFLDIFLKLTHPLPERGDSNKSVELRVGKKIWIELSGCHGGHA
jgi:hypothetical protein